MFSPSIIRRPSLLRPPWIGNCVVAVAVTTSFQIGGDAGHDRDRRVVAADRRIAFRTSLFNVISRRAL